jgi:DNA-binding transcriptional LysR family regulator
MDMDVRHMKMFVAVAEEGSIRRAAQKCFTAQPQVSQVIRRLEREIGVDLLERSHRGVELTPAGVVLLDQARHLISKFDHAVQKVRDTAVARPLVVGLMAGQIAAAELTVPIIRAFKDAYPGVPIKIHECTFEEQFRGLTDGDVDIALVRPPCSEDRLTVLPLFREPRMVCMSKSHPLADASNLSVDDILYEPMIDLVNVPRKWVDFWLLNDLRQEPGQTRSTPAVTIAELKFTLMFDDVLMPIAGSAWRMGLEDPSLKAIPLSDAAPSEIAVAFNPEETRPEVRAFAACAQETSRLMINRIPGGNLCELAC